MSFNPSYFFPTTIVNITGLNGGLYGTVQSTDVYPAVDTTDVTQSPTGTTKPYRIIDLVNYVLKSLTLHIYSPVLAASTANLTATYNNGASGVGATLTNSSTQAAFTLDGQAGVLNERYLIKDQSTSSQNGIYTLTTVGDGSTNWVLTRATDFNSPTTIVSGGLVYVFNGTVNKGTTWQDIVTSPITVGTSAIIYNEYSSPVLNPIPNNDVLANISGGSAVATGTSVTSLIDSAISNTQGSVLFRNATQWTNLSPGTSGYFLQTQGTNADVTWATYGKVNAGTIGQIAYYAASGDVVSGENEVTLAQGGTNANLTASNGGIVYSNASALAILAGTATANQIMLSGLSSAPSWSTATYLPTLTANGLLFASATNTMAQITTANSSILVTNGSGVPSWSTTLPFTVPATTGGTGVASPTAHTIPVAEGASNFNFVGPLTNGQLLIGSTGADPVAASLTAGTNITITPGAGSITIAASGIGGGTTTYSDIFLMMGA